MSYTVITRSPRSTARTANGRDLERHERSGTTDVSRVTVATLEEARSRIDEELSLQIAPATLAAVGEAKMAIANLPESGGTVALPDCTVIEVKKVA